MISGATATSSPAPNATVLPVPGQPKAIALPFNQVSTAVALALTHGGKGIYGVVNGLTLSASASLALPVAAGTAIMSSQVSYAGGTVTVPASQSVVYIWFSLNGTLTPTTTPVSPAGTWICIGNCATNASQVTSVDYSGVWQVGGALPYRITGDFDAPGDNPGVIGVLTITQGGTYLWDGTYWRKLGGDTRSAIVLSSATTILTGGQAGAKFLDFSGTPGAAPTVTLPLIAGKQYTVRNGTTGGYALTLAGATGGSVSVANGSVGIIVCDGANWILVTGT